MTPIVSIIIPYYNSWKYIEETLNSIYKQKYKNYEVIIVDDKSEDLYSINMLNIIKIKYNDLIIINLNKNKWPCIARNEWAKISKWKYLLFIDSDDIINNETIELYINEIEKSWINIWYIYSDYELFWEKNNIINCNEYNIIKLLEDNIHIISNLIKKDIFLKIWWFDWNLKKWLEDWELYINIAKHWFVWKHINYIWFKIRNHSDSRSFTSANKNLRDIYNYIEKKHWKFFEQYGKLNSLFLFENLIPNFIKPIYRLFIKFIPKKILLEIRKLIIKK